MPIFKSLRWRLWVHGGASLVELRKRIDDDFYALSVAYYQRLVAPGLQKA